MISYYPDVIWLGGEREEEKSPLQTKIKTYTHTHTRTHLHENEASTQGLPVANRERAQVGPHSP